VFLLQEFVERGRLRHRARKAVENESILHVGLVEAVGNDPDHDLIRHQRAAGHDVPGLQADRRLGGDRRTQHLAGRKLDDAVLLDQPLRLGPLARARRTQKDQSHDYSPPGGERNAAHPLLKFRPQPAAHQRRRPLNLDFLISPSY
jgi:hypothetical protein